jgi:hypothetical protein
MKKVLGSTELKCIAPSWTHLWVSRIFGHIQFPIQPIFIRTHSHSSMDTVETGTSLNGIIPLPPLSPSELELELAQFALLQRFIATRRRNNAAAAAVAVNDPQFNSWQDVYTSTMNLNDPPSEYDLPGLVICKRCERTIAAPSFEQHWNTCEQTVLVSAKSPHHNAPSPHAHGASPSTDGIGSGAGTKRKRAKDAPVTNEEEQSGGKKKKKPDKSVEHNIPYHTNASDQQAPQ